MSLLKKRGVICSTVLFLLGTHIPTASAAEVNITWEEPESFTDVRPSNESRKRFRERTLSELEAHISELASALPEHYVLSMTVTNLDLAGQVWPAQFVGLGNNVGNDVRLIQRVDIPRMNFTYSLNGENSKVLKADDVKLKDMAFLESHTRRRANENLAYEKAMLDTWFNDTFAEHVVKPNS
ncbi:DUF3016 domain-containing protein [Alteromonas sp. A079]|uniref:DUF3016 domain-containing protein n=1 Tax=Alteromonas sp. A079 TaxID=3410268 RepID=UPI003BA04C2D